MRSTPSSPNESTRGRDMIPAQPAARCAASGRPSVIQPIMIRLPSGAPQEMGQIKSPQCK